MATCDASKPSIISLTAVQTHGALPPTGPRAGFDSGDPQTSGLPLANSPGLRSGIWECTPGSWPIPTRKDTENCYILSGKVIVSSVDGKHKFGPGDAFVMPVGWEGRWKVLETVRKFYVISE